MFTVIATGVVPSLFAVNVTFTRTVPFVLIVSAGLIPAILTEPSVMLLLIVAILSLIMSPFSTLVAVRAAES